MVLCFLTEGGPVESNERYYRGRAVKLEGDVLRRLVADVPHPVHLPRGVIDDPSGSDFLAQCAHATRLYVNRNVVGVHVRGIAGAALKPTRMTMELSQPARRRVEHAACDETPRLVGFGCGRLAKHRRPEPILDQCRGASIPPEHHVGDG